MMAVAGWQRVLTAHCPVRIRRYYGLLQHQQNMLQDYVRYVCSASSCPQASLVIKGCCLVTSACGLLQDRDVLRGHIGEPS